MKLITILILFSFLGSCSKGQKIQKNAVFKPVCETGTPHCKNGALACETKPGSGEMKVI